MSDQELVAIAKLQQEGMLLEDELGAEGAGGDATRRLLGNYTATPGLPASTMRTPRLLTAEGKDPVLAEAMRIKAMMSAPTPLIGGGAEEAGAAIAQSDFGGIVPARKAAATPNPMAALAAGTPHGAGGSMGQTPGALLRGGMMTPGRGGPAGALPGSATPSVRDQLGLNDPEALAAADRMRQAQLAGNLRMGLSALPAPKHEYQVVAPELPHEEDAAAMAEEDAEERDARIRAAEEARRQIELKKRSQVLQRGLPRPPAIPQPPPAEEAEAAAARDGPSLLRAAEALVARELSSFISFETAKYPLPGTKPRGQPPAAAEDFELDELAEASLLVRMEAEELRAAWGQDGTTDEEFAEAWESTYR